jgi:DNA-binding beta-propeller fold protein YncE
MKHSRLLRTLCAFILTIATTVSHAAPGDFIDIFASEPALSQPHGIGLGPDGNLYVSSQSGQSVLRFDGATGVFIDNFAGQDLSLSLQRRFTPAGLVFGPDGNL